MAAILPAEGNRAKLKVLVPDDYGDRVRHLECAKRFPQFELNVVPGPVREKKELARLLADSDAPGYAAVDVFESEPVTGGDHPLLGMRNVICMPHMGYVNWQEYETLFGEAFDSIADFFGGKPKNIANPEVLAR